MSCVEVFFFNRAVRISYLFIFNRAVFLMESIIIIIIKCDDLLLILNVLFNECL